MLKALSLFLFAAAMVAASGYAQQAQVTIPVNKTRADNGRQMYVNYCAPCHGVDGRGNGAVATELKVPPPDLSMLSKNNQGMYPAVHVEAVLRFGVSSPAHGSKEMPIWGPVFHTLDHPAGSSDIEALRISNVVRYVETLQAK